MDDMEHRWEMKGGIVSKHTNAQVLRCGDEEQGYSMKRNIWFKKLKTWG